MSYRRYLIVLLLTLVVSFSIVSLTRSESVESDNVSPHVQALSLVFQTQQQQIQKLDSEDWWIDTKTRQWSVTRPVPPGTLDSTHWFTVTYQIEGKNVGSWFVDTRQKTVTGN